jgi:hypothetical protein
MDNRDRKLAAWWVAGVALIVAALSFGCGTTTMPDYDKGRGVLTEAAKACYSTVSVFHEKRNDEIQDDYKAKKITSEEGIKRLDDWLVIYKQGRLVCQAGDELVEAAANARPLVELAKDRSKQAGAWIVRLTSFALSIPASLARLGIVGGK